MKMKKLLSIAAMVMLCVTVLSSCGSAPGAATAPPADNNAATAAPDAAAPQDAPTPIKILTQKFPTTINPEDMPMYQDIEKNYNVDLLWEEIPYETFGERKGVILASNELPDIFFAGLSDNDITTNSNLFLDMRPYMDKMPNVQNLFATKAGAEIVSTFPPDDAVYALPQVYGFSPRSGITSVEPSLQLG